MLKVEHVTFRYERRGAPVLRDASLSLETGQVGVLLGRNGCGKTTLLKTRLGLCTPEQGQILFDGQALGAMKRQQRAQVAAYVPQELQFGALRVYDAVLAGRVRRFGVQPGAADRTAAEAALADMDLPALAERNVQTLSGGERQKVAIARALAQDPASGAAAGLYSGHDGAVHPARFEPGHGLRRQAFPHAGRTGTIRRKRGHTYPGDGVGYIRCAGARGGDRRTENTDRSKRR